MRLTELLSDADAQSENLIWIDHREEEDTIVECVSAAIDGRGGLFSEWKDDAWFISYQDQSYQVPLTMSPHDRYVAISSLARVLEPEYEFWLLASSLDGDTHGLLVVDRAELQSLSPADRTALNSAFAQLKLGHDYFSGLAVPFVGNENANPNLMKQSNAQREAAMGLVDQVLASPKMTRVVDSMKAELAKLFSRGNDK